MLDTACIRTARSHIKCAWRRNAPHYCSKISGCLTCGGDPYPEGWSCVHSETRFLRVGRARTRPRARVRALRRVACNDLTSSGYNANQYRVLRNISSTHRVHPLCSLPGPGTTVVRPIRGRPGGVLVLDFRCTRKWLFDDRVYPFLVISVIFLSSTIIVVCY